METAEIKCLKSMLNVAERAKKGKNRYISGFRACSGARGREFESRHFDQRRTDTEMYQFFLLRRGCFYYLRLMATIA